MKESLIRTYVPWLVGLVGPWAGQWLGLDNTQLTAWLTVVVGAAYYGIARVLEVYVHPRFGWLIGVPVQPQYVRDGRHELGRREDAGQSRVWDLLVAGVIVAAMIVATVVFGGDAEARRRPTPWTGITRATSCGGMLAVTYASEQLDGRTWAPLPDQGGVTMQIHRIGAAAGPGGSWEPVPGALYSEGHATADITGTPPWDQVRVVSADGVASAPRTPAGCAA